MIELQYVGLVVQTVGAGLLAVIFLYLSRGKGNRVLEAAGFGWLFLFLSLIEHALRAALRTALREGALPVLQAPLLVALCVAAIRMDRDVSLVKPLAVAAIAALPLSFLITQHGERPTTASSRSTWGSSRSAG